LVMEKACNSFLSGDYEAYEVYEILKGLQEYDKMKVIFYDEVKKNELYQDKGIDIIKQNTQVKTRHIVKAIDLNSVDFLRDILPKYEHIISDKIMSKCNTKLMCDLIKEHNEKYT